MYIKFSSCIIVVTNWVARRLILNLIIFTFQCTRFFKMFWQPSFTIMCSMWTVCQCSPSQSPQSPTLNAAVPTGVRLVTSRSHHLPLISEGTGEENAPSSTDPSQSSVQTPGSCGEGRELPYSCLPSQYEVVVAHYVRGDVDNVFDRLQQTTSTRQMASSTPPETAYTVVPVKVCGHAFCNHWHFSLPALFSQTLVCCQSITSTLFQQYYTTVWNDAVPCSTTIFIVFWTAAFNCEWQPTNGSACTYCSSTCRQWGWPSLNKYQYISMRLWGYFSILSCSWVV